ncbi:MAG: hypothetical protein ACXVZM_06955 [Terriglobales bacterium]
MRRFGPYLLLSLILTVGISTFIALSTSAAASPASASDSKVKTDGKPPTRLLIRSGTLVSEEGAPIQLRAFEADIATGTDGKSEHIGNKIVLVKTGEAFLSNESLSQLLTSKLKDHNLQDIKVTNDKGRMKITGQAKKGVTVPFTIEGPVSLTDKGQIRLEMEKEKVAHLPKGAVELLGISPEKLAGDGTVKGVSMDKNFISFDPDLLWGLPVHGQVTRLAVQNNGLLLKFGAQPQKKRATQLRAEGGR